MNKSSRTFGPICEVASPAQVYGVPVDGSKHYIYVQYGNDDELATLVSPSAGAATFTGSIEGTLFQPIANGTTALLASYTPLSVAGLLQSVIATPTTPIVGATHWRLLVVSY